MIWIRTRKISSNAYNFFHRMHQFFFFECIQFFLLVRIIFFFECMNFWSTMDTLIFKRPKAWMLCLHAMAANERTKLGCSVYVNARTLFRAKKEWPRQSMRQRARSDQHPPQFWPNKHKIAQKFYCFSNRLLPHQQRLKNGQFPSNIHFEHSIFFKASSIMSTTSKKVYEDVK